VKPQTVAIINQLERGGTFKAGRQAKRITSVSERRF
jgi:hypothetical protein